MHGAKPFDFYFKVLHRVCQSKARQKMIIYKITNLLDKKIYIGQTQRTLEERMKEHCRNRRKSYIYNAIKKYGIENFSAEVIETCETVEELNEREIFWIKFFDCKRPNGYNLTDGGEGCRGYIVTAETRKKISESHKGKCGRICSEETKAKISAANKGHSVSEKSRAMMSAAHKGKKLSEETKAKMSASKKNKRTIICIEKEKIFESIADAARWANISACTIITACKNKNRTAGGYHWEYLK